MPPATFTPNTTTIISAILITYGIYFYNEHGMISILMCTASISAILFVYAFTTDVTIQYEKECILCEEKMLTTENKEFVICDECKEFIKESKESEE